MNKADYQKKKDAKTLLMQNNLSRTPEVRVGQPSDVSISQDSEVVKKNRLKSNKKPIAIAIGIFMG